MSKVSVSELRDYFEKHMPNRIIFTSENQLWYDAITPCKVELIFSTVRVSLNPALLVLESAAGTLCLDRVRFAEIDCKSSVLGTVIQVHCGGDESQNKGRTVYTLVMQ